MIRRPPRSTRTDTLFPYTTLFRSRHGAQELILQRGDLALQQRDRIFVGRQPAGMADIREVDQGLLAEIDRSLYSRLPAAGLLGVERLFLLLLFSHDETATPRSEERRVGKECGSTG